MAEAAPKASGRAEAADRLVGRMLGDYLVKRPIGRGGMGFVYEAVQASVGGRVAIKVLTQRAVEDPKYEEHVERFRREAVAIGRLRHPGLVQVHGYHQREDGLSYIVMEYLDGESLGARLTRLRAEGKPPPQAHVVELGRQLASALQAAHAARIVHRDLKPENVMLTRDPAARGGERAKVLDFGIAKFLTDGPSGSFTTQNVAMGTPTYMAPEQCEGAQTVDGRVDVYSLGVMLYEILAGRPPFVASTSAQVLIQQMTKRPPALLDLAPQVSEDLGALVHDMLAKDPQKRPDMAEVEQRLGALRLGARAWPRRRLVLGVSAFAFALGLGLALLLSRPAPRETAGPAAPATVSVRAPAAAVPAAAAGGPASTAASPRAPAGAPRIVASPRSQKKSARPAPAASMPKPAQAAPVQPAAPAPRSAPVKVDPV